MKVHLPGQSLSLEHLPCPAQCVKSVLHAGLESGHTKLLQGDLSMPMEELSHKAQSKQGPAACASIHWVL